MRTKPYMSGPEDQPDEGPCAFPDSEHEPNLETQLELLRHQNANLVQQLQQVNLAFAAHLSECQGQEESEPRKKRCL